MRWRPVSPSQRKSKPGRDDRLPGCGNKGGGALFARESDSEACATQKTMNCEWIEDHLSAYKDHELDAAANDQVATHLVGCVKCHASLDEYIRFDRLLTELPRMTPRPELRARIFSSPEFRAILSERNGHGVSKAPASHQLPSLRSPALVTRALIGVTVILLLLASAGVVLRSLAAHPTTTCPSPTTGEHVLTRSADGALVLGAQRFPCAQHTQATDLWQVSPNGQWIAYIAAHTGDIHTVRANGQGDHVFHAAGVSSTATIALVWSHKSQKLLAVTRDQADGAYSVTFWAADPAGAATASALTFMMATPDIIGPVWSPDDLAVAYAFTHTGIAPSANVLNYAAIPTSAIEASTPLPWSTASSGSWSFASTISAFSWTSGTQIALTAALATTTALTSLVTINPDPRAAPLTYTPRNGPITAAAFDATGNRWAVALSDGTLLTFNPLTQHTTSLAHLNAVSSLTWSPDGQHLIARSNATLWWLDNAPARRLAANAGPVAPAWQADSSTVAYVDGSQVMVATLTGEEHQVKTDATLVKGLIWSPGGQLIVWGINQAVVVDASGNTAQTISPSPTEAPQWTSVP